MRSLYPNLSVSPRVCCGILRSQVFNFSSGDINATLERFEKAANSNHVQRESKSNKDYRSLAKLGDEEYVDDNDVNPGQYGDNGYNNHHMAEKRYGIGERQDEDDYDEAGIYGEKTTTSSGSSPEDDGKGRQEAEDWGGPRSRSGRRLRLDTEKAAGCVMFGSLSLCGPRAHTLSLSCSFSIDAQYLLTTVVLVQHARARSHADDIWWAAAWR